MDDTKKCRKCQQIKLTTDFYYRRYNNGKTAPHSYCKECISKIMLRNHERTRQRPKPIINQKTCQKCNKTLPIQEFQPDQTKKDGYVNSCKKCSLNLTRERRREISKRSKPQIDGKICPSCKIYKPAEDFCQCKPNLDGLNQICRECVKKIDSLRRPKDRIKRREKYHNDTVCKLTILIRTRINRAVKTQSKSAHTLELLGCTGQECMEYLKKLFWPGMTRENMGRNGWVIDHIKPVDAFDKNNPNWQFECFHYTNLQPLWWADNRTKSNRLDWTPQESKYELPERLKAHLDKTPESGGIS